MVDDEEAHRETLSEILAYVGHDVDTAEDGLVAVEKATAAKYDVIIMDIRMPNMDGLAATEALCQIDPEQVIIILSAYLDEDKRKKVETLGVRRIIAKPIRSAEIINAIASLG